MTGPFELLWRLSKIDSPSGDEAEIADFLTSEIAAASPSAKLTRLGSSVIAIRGTPKAAIFAHVDTTGFTLGYDRKLIPIGGPDAKSGDRLRQVGAESAGHVVEEYADGRWRLAGEGPAIPGSRWVYDEPLVNRHGVISGPYLDNRAGVWAALRALDNSKNIAVAFTEGEESSGHGALVCSSYLYNNYQITKALISDITWHTKHVHNGEGVAVSLRDRYVPNQRFLSEILRLTVQSGIPFQREIETDGGSDGSYILKSAIPMDWVFVGAPEEHPHSSKEILHAADLQAMADLLTALIEGIQ